MRCNIRKLIKSCCFVLLLTGGAAAKADVCGAIAGNAVSNCGFETGDFSGWTLAGNLQGGAPPNNFYGVDQAFPNSGSWEAYLGVQGGEGTAIGTLGPFLELSQTLNLLPGEYYKVSFFYDQNGPDPSPGYVNYIDLRFGGELRGGLIDAPNSGGVYLPVTLVFATSGNAAAAAHTVLQFDFQNDADVWYFDDVSVTAIGPVPEPASWGLLLAAAGAGWLLRRRFTSFR
ncbi:MAG TPA: PEP-CTERM sorting domain-containing protein [Bryobacteraceae bacterium]|jgi:hypothetical protein